MTAADQAVMDAARARYAQQGLSGPAYLIGGPNDPNKQWGPTPQASSWGGYSQPRVSAVRPQLSAGYTPYYQQQPDPQGTLVPGTRAIYQKPDGTYWVPETGATAWPSVPLAQVGGNGSRVQWNMEPAATVATAPTAASASRTASQPSGSGLGDYGALLAQLQQIFPPAAVQTPGPQAGYAAAGSFYNPAEDYWQQARSQPTAVGTGAVNPTAVGYVQQMLEQYNRAMQEAAQRGEADRERALAAAQSIADSIRTSPIAQQVQSQLAQLAQNPYGPEWLAQSVSQQQDERSRALAAAEENLRAQYGQLGRPVDPRVLAYLRTQVAQQSNADLRDLQLAAAGQGFDATRASAALGMDWANAQANAQQRSAAAMIDILGNTNYGPSANDLALMLQLGQLGAYAPSTGSGQNWQTWY